MQPLFILFSEFSVLFITLKLNIKIIEIGQDLTAMFYGRQPICIAFTTSYQVMLWQIKDRLTGLKPVALKLVNDKTLC